MTSSQVPGLRPFTEEWAAVFRDAINASEAYRESAQRWTWPLALILDATPDFGYPAATAMLLDLEKGHCRGVSVLPATDVSAPFAVSGDYAAWKQVIRGELDPILAITRRRLKLAGSLATIMMHARSAKVLVSCASAVPTTFADERLTE